MKQAKKILAVLIALALIAGIVGGVIFAVQKTSRRTIPVYRAEDLNYGGYMYNMGSTMEGYVTADAAQNVYPASELAVREVLVQVGQEVFVGDVLLTYDTEKTQMNLEKAELSRQQIQLQLDVATRNLSTLGKLKAVTETGDDEAVSDDVYEYDEEEWVDVEIEDEVEEEENSEEPSDEKDVSYDKLTEDSLAYNREDYVNITVDDLDPEMIAGMTDEEIEVYIAELTNLTRPGTEDNPYRFLCQNGAVIEPSFINHLKKLAEERAKSLYIQIEVREGDRTDGSLIEAWKMDASRFIEVEKDWRAIILVEDYITTPSPTPSAIPSGNLTPTVGPTGSITPTADPSGSVTPTADLTGSITPADDSSGTVHPEVSDEPETSGVPDDSSGTVTAAPVSPTGSVIPEGTEVPDETQSDAPDESGTDANVTSPPAADDSSDSSSQEESSGLVGSGISGVPAESDGMDSGTYHTVTGNMDGGISFATANITTKYLLTAIDTSESSGKTGSFDSSQIAAMLGLISSDAQMTSEELKEAKKQEEQTIKSLKLDLREAALKLRAAQKAVEEGTERAKMNGVVKAVTDPDAALASGSPIVQVTAAEGLFVRSALPENLYDTVKVGDIVSIISWTSGQSFSGRIRDIAFYPDTSGMFGYGSQTTYYPMTVYISERSEALSDGEWVQVTVNGSGEGSAEIETNSLYLYRAFIREDSSGKYVLKRGDDGRLVKQYVTTGELSGEGYEILSGVTGEDWLAFPYGRNLTEGLETREGSVDELYAS